MAVDVATTPKLQEYQLLINGQMQPAASGETFVTVNPATNEPVDPLAPGE